MIRDAGSQRCELEDVGVDGIKFGKALSEEEFGNLLNRAGNTQEFSGSTHS
jgi:hypothetical protein